MVDHPHFPSDGSALRLVDALPMGVLVLGPEGTIAFGNERAHETLGAVLVGASISDLFAPMEVFLSTLEEGRKEMPLPHPRTGDVRQFGFSLSILEKGSRGPERYLLVFQDITEANRLRDERDRLLQIAAVGDVLPSLLHEIKNPLASIRSTVELMVEEAGEGPLRQELHAVLTEIQRIALTLEGVGRIRQDLRSFRSHAIDQACLEAFSVLRQPAKEKGIHLSAYIPTLPLLPFDPGGFRAVVYNLLTNAIHACQSGDRIQLRLGLEEGWLTLEVEDSGCGMSPEVLARCQEIFFTTRAKGTGIGLALCTSLAESARGTLKVDSTPGSGTRITLRVPETPTLPGGTHVQS